MYTPTNTCIGEMPGKMSSWKEREIIKVTGDSQVTYKPVFTEDSKYLIVPCGQNVLIYSVKTGQLALTLKHHTDIVTHIELGPSKSMKLLSSSLDGCIGIWDYTDGALLKSFNCGIPIYCFRLQPTDDDNPLLVMVVQNEQDSSLSAVLTIPSQFVMTNKSLGVAFNEVTTSILHCVSFRQVLFTYDGRYIVSYSKQKLYLYHFDKEQIFQYSMKSVITAVACHPAKHCIATGNTMGEIHLWYNYGRKDKSFVTRTKLHWHAHSVNDLCFTSDGVYLASGGEEGVLVYWQLATDHKHFRPRLGAPLMNLACSNDDNMFAVCLLNNTIMLISGLDNEVWTELVTLYKALPGMGYKANVSTGLVYNRHYKSIVLNSLPGCLQFYDFTRNKVKAQMEIVQLNYVSRPDDDVLSPTTVDIVAFSSCGKYLATIDSWECKGLSSETKLKFWKFDSNENKYTLTTVCDPPHQSHVTGLVFRPSSLKEEFSYNDDSEMSYSDMYVVTTGMDGYFKVWCTSMTTHKKKKKLTWNCKSATSYLDQPCYGCKFSSDGSLVAANFNKFITLWDFWSLELKHVFNSFTGDAFTNVLFGCGEASYYLMASSGHRFYVWNLLTLHIELVLSLTIDFMVNDPSSDAVALFTSKTNKLNGTSSNLVIFSPLLPSPLAKYSNVATSRIKSAIFIPTSDSCSQLYFMDENQLLYTVSKPDDDDGDEDNDRINLLDEKGVSSEMIYREIFGTDKSSLYDKDQNGDIPTTNKINKLKGDKMLSGPPHALPPMSICCKNYLSLMMKTLSVTLPTTNTQLMEVDNNNGIG